MIDNHVLHGLLLPQFVSKTYQLTFRVRAAKGKCIAVVIIFLTFLSTHGEI